jgi:hypothetical protein
MLPQCQVTSVRQYPRNVIAIAYNAMVASIKVPCLVKGVPHRAVQQMPRPIPPSEVAIIKRSWGLSSAPTINGLQSRFVF